MNFYKHYLGDYARDTQDLALVEHGAYRVLLDHFYATKGDMPNDISGLYRIAKAFTPTERKAVDKVAEKFFPPNGDGRRHNRRAEVEIQKHLGQAQANKIVADAREQKRREQKSLFDAHNERSTNRAPNHSQKPEETKASPAIAGEVRGVAATVPDCPHEKLIELYHELLPSCTKVVEWNDGRRALMRARWREQAMKKGGDRGYTTVEAGLAFWRRFFGWVSKSPFLTGNGEGRNGGAPFVATLEWLIRPKNFVKVVEGNYHR
jgi:uncharacterized protein YdaU (DUF1376 family)